MKLTTIRFCLAAAACVLALPSYATAVVAPECSGPPGWCVQSVVTQEGTKYRYDIFVETTDFYGIYAWGMPYFSDAGITGITSHNSNWAGVILDVDNDYGGAYTGWDGTVHWPVDAAGKPSSASTQVLWWYNGPEGSSEDPIGGPYQFSFLADYNSTAYPHAVYTVSAGYFSGDPQGPASPCALGNCTTSNIPEPATLALLGLGLTGLAALRRRR